jgi:alkanesulfonate monooxygenase SsuD/methylene tetrahydromethanopterin reductase-like flavin-dependent oxidoreductase (luciferase family)
MGGLAEAAIRRAGRHGLSLLLPNTLGPAELQTRLRIWREEANKHGQRPGRLGMLVDVWIIPDDRPDEVQNAKDRLALHYREYTGAFYKLRGAPAFTRPDLLDAQSSRTRAAAVIGDAATVAEGLCALRDQGVDGFVLQMRCDARPAAYREVMRQFAQDVLPKMRA